ncbi:hypothetical protein GXW83_01720 [Streptacidiphilus sp. PB12-B1b]|uniref:hypothetical protein n=1 Tax=Streptacidiphilus sp. PB12-B1b TaxID=2705012 RepID=UPI0015F82A09|nr:hypothetical protein [Streptacidiphilus sp. PB12-B1b]QMU74689.1 hypothetical protein GXW83_01720 [Streptacidiphilus sp. PB12-B1b]
MISAVLLVAGVSAAVWLGVRALRSWREQRAVLAYELTPRYTGVAVRLTAALAAVGCALTGGVQYLDARHQPGTGSAVSAMAAGRSVAQDADPARPGSLPGSARPSTAVPPSASSAPSTPSAPSALSAPSAPPTVVGHPAGGELLEGTLPGCPGRLRIWLPPQYARRTHPLQTLVVLADQQDLPDLLSGLAAAVDEGRANPLVVVAPESAPGSAPAADGSAQPDAPRLHAAMLQAFHVEPSAHGWAVLGLDADARGAVAADLAHPDWYAAGVGVDGRYEALPPGLLSAGGSGVRLLLADTQRDTAGQQSAARLRRALTSVPQADVRLSDTVRDLTDQSERVRLARLSAAYLAEQMATDTRP